MQNDDSQKTIRDWYQSYATSEARDVFIIPPKSIGKAYKKSSFLLELYIDIERYEERTTVDENGDVGVSDKGRKRKGGGRTSRVPLNKRTRSTTTTILQTTFLPDSATNISAIKVQHVDQVQFRQTICKIQPGTGTPSLSEVGTTETGIIDRDTLPLAAHERGKTKDVFGFTIKDEEFVAKKLVNIGEDSEDITTEKAAKLLVADLVHLKRMAYFAKVFFSLAGRLGVEMAEFQVSDAFLIKVYNFGDPRTNSDVVVADADESDHEPVLESVYLVEPKRTSMSVIKFTGTLGQVHMSGQLLSTIMAFAHFVLENTACKYMFADIQGSYDKNGLLVLFDPMTHTPSQSSGLGDHGLAGIRDFIESHQCNSICSALKLASVSALESTLDALPLNDD
ncbi:hypothetical protein JAAARDRAFT_193673 [Jaapia argillacea MUCL 33604]|uniref:Alpha-type protein kinase domain-containing protein n=1 Tax=Jaapia argillacea MUCL 33604 TaxID=933084 RepID=A0A067Q6M1_9AGAM|nr:hypothetical protein JAAARDRAFT_193673 [Jaapia argillacea MUCL 33604]